MNGMPADLAAALGGGGPAGPMPAGPPPGAGAPTLPPALHAALNGNDPDGDGDSPQEEAAEKKALEAGIAALQNFVDVETDPAKRAIVATCIAQLHKLQAQEQSESDSAMGVTPTQKFIRNKVLPGQ